MSEANIRLIYSIGLLIAWLPSVVFPFIFHKTTKWWTTVIGQHLMGYSVGIAIVLTASVIRVFWPDFIGRTVFSVGSILIMAGIAWWRLIAFIYTRNHKEE